MHLDRILVMTKNPVSIEYSIAIAKGTPARSKLSAGYSGYGYLYIWSTIDKDANATAKEALRILAMLLKVLSLLLPLLIMTIDVPITA